MEYDTELQKNNSLEYGLPDGNIITLKEERFKSPEILFNPSLIGMEEKGLGENAYTSINCDGDRVNIKLCERIVLTGGNTLFPGFSRRISQELQTALPYRNHNVISQRNRINSPWLGGSILTCLSTFNPMWVTKLEYEEIGTDIVHRKCF